LSAVGFAVWSGLCAVGLSWMVIGLLAGSSHRNHEIDDKPENTSHQEYGHTVGNDIVGVIPEYDEIKQLRRLVVEFEP
jgi:hypothetical protein